MDYQEPVEPKRDETRRPMVERPRATAVAGQPALAEMIDRISALRNRTSDVTASMCGNIDCLRGAEPEPDVAEGLQTVSKYDGALGELHSTINALETAVDRLERQSQRLRGLA